MTDTRLCTNDRKWTAGNGKDGTKVKEREGERKGTELRVTYYIP